MFKRVTKLSSIVWKNNYGQRLTYMRPSQVSFMEFYLRKYLTGFLELWSPILSRIRPVCWNIMPWQNPVLCVSILQGSLLIPFAPMFLLVSMVSNILLKCYRMLEKIEIREIVVRNGLISFRARVQCVKSVHIHSFSGPYFPAFGLNTERYSVSLLIQSGCGKMWTRKIPNTDTFHPWKLNISSSYKWIILPCFYIFLPKRLWRQKSWGSTFPLSF